MKAFFERYSYTIIKLFLNQFAIALFGVALAISCSAAGRNTLLWVTSIFSVLFYLFLQYAVMWEVGAKDGISATARHESRKLWRGPVISLIANSPNLIFAILTLFPEGGKVESVGRFLALLAEGMYQGLLAQPFRGIQLNGFDWVYFAIIVPAVLVSSVAYILGSYNLHATNILIPKNPDVKNNGRPK